MKPEIPHDYPSALSQALALRAETSRTSKALQVFPRGPMGLTPDHIKASPEFRAAKLAFDRAFATERAFNSVFVPRFKKEEKARRDAERKTKLSLL